MGRFKKITDTISSTFHCNYEANDKWSWKNVSLSNQENTFYFLGCENVFDADSARGNYLLCATLKV